MQPGISPIAIVGCVCVMISVPGTNVIILSLVMVEHFQNAVLPLHRALQGTAHAAAAALMTSITF